MRGSLPSKGLGTQATRGKARKPTLEVQVCKSLGRQVGERAGATGAGAALPRTRLQKKYIREEVYYHFVECRWPRKVLLIFSCLAAASFYGFRDFNEFPDFGIL